MARTGHRGYRRRRAAVLRGEDLICAWCGDPIDKTIAWPDPMSPSADHVTPVSKGGHNLGPLQPMHLGCNIKKGAGTRPPTRHAREW